MEISISICVSIGLILNSLKKYNIAQFDKIGILI